jgi:hypothetical protein
VAAPHCPPLRMVVGETRCATIVDSDSTFRGPAIGRSVLKLRRRNKLRSLGLPVCS